MRLAKCILAVLFVAVFSGHAWARGGGGCLREGTAVLTPAGKVLIENLQPGSVVLGLRGGHLGPVRVESVIRLEVLQYLEIKAGGRSFRVTPEHPIMTGPGEFTLASGLKRGDRLYIDRGSKLKTSRISSIRPVKADKPAYNLLVQPGGVYFPEGIAVHNKGCFLPDSPILKADGRQIPISAIKPGDEVMAFTGDGKLVRTKVRELLRARADSYRLVTTALGVLRVTGEHPFYVGGGKFKTLDSLKAGDTVFACDGKTLSPQRIVSIKKIPGRIEVYNLQTETPHTFFAGHIAVHNKGGGGCFPAGVLIRTPSGETPIERLSPGDAVTGIDAEGKEVAVRVETLHTTRSGLIEIRAGKRTLFTTVDHPLKLSGGGFHEAGDLVHGSFVDVFDGGKIVPLMIDSVSKPSAERTVYNLTVSGPHVFVASGFVVHNKGGGGFHSSSGYRSGSSSGGGWSTLFFFGPFIAFIIFAVLRARKKSKSEELDFVYGKSQIAAKAAKTEKLLKFLAGQDPSVAPENLRSIADSTFRRLQECWQSADYSPMAPLMMPALYEQHLAQLQGMKNNNEINRIENLKVEKVDLVNVRYTEKPNQREFTALIGASARDYYTDSRNGHFLRGDSKPARFQEFWTFHWIDGKWLLRDIEQSGESYYLKEENFAEMLTDQTIASICGPQAKKKGEAGPWIEKDVEEKAVKIERLLNFLVQTDKIWDRQSMLDRAREVFMAVFLARENGDPDKLPAAALTEQVAESLRAQLKQWRAGDWKVEYRNLCVRKVELVLVQNYEERDKDEFTVRISAHAQRILSRGGQVVNRDRYVTPFEDFWTFGRSETLWKLKEVLPAAEGQKLMTMENVDEDSTPAQLDWYYKQPRAQ